MTEIFSVEPVPRELSQCASVCFHFFILLLVLSKIWNSVKPILPQYINRKQILFKNADSVLRYIFISIFVFYSYARLLRISTTTDMFTDRQTTPSKGLPGTPTTTEHTYAVPIFNPFIPLAPTISPLSSTQDIRLTLSPSHSSVVAKMITSERRGDSPSPPPITKHAHRKSEPTIRTSHYLINQTRSFFSPQSNIGAANTTVIDPIQHWVNHSTPTPPQVSPPPHTNTTTATTTNNNPNNKH